LMVLGEGGGQGGRVELCAGLAVGLPVPVLWQPVAANAIKASRRMAVFMFFPIYPQKQKAEWKSLSTPLVNEVRKYQARRLRRPSSCSVNAAGSCLPNLA